MLMLAWLSRRLAYELAGGVYGEAFHCSAMGLSEPVVREHVTAGGTVLDVGCGRGRWSRVAARYAGSVVGIDHDNAAIDAARREGGANIEYLLANATRPLEELVGARRFDLVLLVHILEHVDDPVALLRDLQRVASHALIEVPDLEADPLNLVRQAVGAPFYSDADHVREYTGELLRSHLAAAGWTLERIDHTHSVIVATARAT